MRKRVLKLIVTFDDIQQAVACERKFNEAEIGERLIPLPGQISAGCGLAWKAELDQKNKIENFLKGNKILYDNFYEVYLLERY